jgi:hypothetical protein
MYALNFRKHGRADSRTASRMAERTVEQPVQVCIPLATIGTAL